MFLAALLSLSGCSAVKGALKPWVCDCAEEPTQEACADPNPVEQTIAQEEDPTEEYDEEEETTPSLVTQKPITHDPLVPGTLGIDLSATTTLDEKTKTEIRRSFVVRGELTSDQRALIGQFSLRGSREVAILTQGKEWAVYSDNARVATGPVRGTIAEKTLLPQLAPQALVAANIVGDPQLEIVTQEIRVSEAGERTAHLVVYKVFGRGIGRVFDQQFASEVDGNFQPTHSVSILRGDASRWIRVVSTNDKTETVYRWDDWEGMFRIPSIPPTAPARKKVRTPQG